MRRPFPAPALRLALTALALLTLAAAPAAAHETAPAGPGIPRHEVPAAEKWDLTPVYADDEAWAGDFRRVEERLPIYAEHEGRAVSSAAALLACLRFDDRTRELLERVELYAKLTRDLDVTDEANQRRWRRVEDLRRRTDEARAFLRPLLLAIPADRLARWLDAEPGLDLYRRHLADLARERDHVLTPELERVLAQARGVTGAPTRIFTALLRHDLEYPTVTGEDGEPVTVTSARLEAARASLDRRYRRDAYTAFYGRYPEVRHTAAAVLAGRLEAKILEARLRGYGSALEASLAPHGIPTAVYRNLITTVGDGVAPLRRWLELKKELLGIETLHEYDTTVTVFPARKQEYTYAEATALILEAVRPLGERYVRDLRHALASGWVDVRETPGKAQGAYSSGCTPGVHPYVLINWQGQTADLFELAHELGHAMHAWYTVSSQPTVYADYSIFAAEVASTTNEALLAHHLVATADDPETELVRLEQYVNNIRLLYYWATMLAEFELRAYAAAEAGEPATADGYCAMVTDLYAKYYGDALAAAETDAHVWVPLRHLYIADFYLYQYATSLAASERIVAGILADPAAAGRYLEFLRTGNSAPPIEALRRAGVDMESPEPTQAVAARMDGLLDRMEELLDREGAG